MNFGTPVPLLIGIILILGALALFFLEKFRPGYERDSDKVYAVLLLISGLFLLAHLDMELLASFQQLLMAGMLTTLLIESIRNRLPRTEPVSPPLGNRPPPRPRYDERPPTRRVYRAELDDRGVPVPAGGAFPVENRPRQPRMAPAPDPRMAPVQNEYWRGDEYGDRPNRPRQPYEEYRGPAGRLQPSPQPGPGRPQDRPPGRPQDRYPQDRPPQDRPQPDRYADNNGRYGDRPPARPPANAPMPRPSEGSDRPPQNYQPRPDERRPEGPPNGERPANANGGNGGNGGDRPSKAERALNVRPYSEAPKLDLNRPEAPAES